MVVNELKCGWKLDQKYTILNIWIMGFHVIQFKQFSKSHCSYGALVILRIYMEMKTITLWLVLERDFTKENHRITFILLNPQLQKSL